MDCDGKCATDECVCPVDADLDEVRSETERQKAIWRETLDYLSDR